MASTHPTGRFELPTRQYAKHRSDVLRLLQARFGAALNESDREDLYQEAWAGLLEYRRRGRPTPDVAGLLKTIAFRRGRDRLRNRRAEPSDPSDGPLSLALDREPPPDEQVEARADAAICRQIIESLSDRQKKVLKLRYEWQFSPRETQEALRLSKKAYEKQLTRALKRVASAVAEVNSGDWREEQLALLMACESGTASQVERARARRLVASDPTCRAMLRQIRRAAALAPMPILFRLRRAHAVRSWLGQTLGSHVSMPRRLLWGGPHRIGSVLGAGTSAVSLKVAAVSIVGVVAAGGSTAVLVGAKGSPSHAPGLRPTPVRAGAAAAVSIAEHDRPSSAPIRRRRSTGRHPRERPAAAPVTARRAGFAPAPAAADQPAGSPPVAPIASPVNPPSDSAARPPASPTRGNGIAEFGP
jgi:RNA polymerase sigma factor (sigma-70 family)